MQAYEIAALVMGWSAIVSVVSFVAGVWCRAAEQRAADDIMANYHKHIHA